MKILSLYRHIIPLEWNSSGEVHRRQKVLLFFPVIMWGHVFQVPAPQLLEVNHRWSSSSSFYVLLFNITKNWYERLKLNEKTTSSLDLNGTRFAFKWCLLSRPIVSFKKSTIVERGPSKKLQLDVKSGFFRLCGGSWWRSGNDGNCHTLLLGTLGRWVVAAFNWRKNAYYIVLLFYM